MSHYIARNNTHTEHYIVRYRDLMERSETNQEVGSYKTKDVMQNVASFSPRIRLLFAKRVTVIVCHFLAGLLL